jgi:hypothetical protein
MPLPKESSDISSDEAQVDSIAQAVSAKVWDHLESRLEGFQDTLPRRVARRFFTGTERRQMSVVHRVSPWIALGLLLIIVVFVVGFNARWQLIAHLLGYHFAWNYAHQFMGLVPLDWLSHLARSGR